MSMLEHALKYAASGWPIFPLTPNTKVPLAGSNGLKDATTNIDQVKRWWTEHPNANIALATGSISDVDVIDLDKKKGKDGEAAVAAYSAHFVEVPARTKRVFTPSGGSHLYVRCNPAKPVRNRADVLPGVDIRGDGGYVVLPPSTTELGSYRWDPETTAIEIAASTSWYASLPHHLTASRSMQGQGAAMKRDPFRKLEWDMCLDIRGTDGMTIDSTSAGHKYICRCPFHEDRNHSAFFVRKSEFYGYLYCSACDASWATAKKPSELQNQIAEIEARLATLKKIHHDNQC